MAIDRSQSRTVSEGHKLDAKGMLPIVTEAVAFLAAGFGVINDHPKVAIYISLTIVIACALWILFSRRTSSITGEKTHRYSKGLRTTGAAVAILVVAGVIPFLSSHNHARANQAIWKAPTARFFRVNTSGVRGTELGDWQVVRNGEGIAVSISSASVSHVMTVLCDSQKTASRLLSIDSKGRETGTVRVEEQQLVWLPSQTDAWFFDSTTGEELFLIISTDTSLSDENVTLLLEKLRQTITRGVSRKSGLKLLPSDVFATLKQEAASACSGFGVEFHISALSVKHIATNDIPARVP